MSEIREPNAKVASPAAGKTPPKKLINILMILLLILIIIAGVIALAKPGTVQKTKTFIHEKLSKTKTKIDIQIPHEQTPATPKAEESPLLSDEDSSVLATKLPFEIPHKLSEEEADILNRQVSLDVLIQESKDLKFWTADDFKKFLSDQQARRKIYFSWGYEKSLVDLFKNHYLKAETLFNSGNSEAARGELLSALVIPRYSEDARIHRGVALVMLKDFIDDAVRKVKILNSYAVRHNVILRSNQLKEDYVQFLDLTKNEKWDEALAFADRLQESAKELETQTKEVEVQYPPVFAQIDPDIKASLNVPAEDFISISSNVNAFLADLRIKRATIEANTPKSLEMAKIQYEAAIKAIEDKHWDEARTALELVSYPPDIAQDAKHKAAVIAKAFPRKENT